MSTYEILNDNQEVINTIIADLEFVEQIYPGHYREVLPPPHDYTVINKQQAQSLLTETDWTELPSVTATSSNPYLLNKDDFISYRNEVRAIAVNPPSTEITNWPVKPTEEWSN